MYQILIQKKIRRDLKGLDYDLSERGIVEHIRFSEWIDLVIATVE